MWGKPPALDVRKLYRLKAHQKPLRENLRAIEECGEYCDCEVLLNVSVSRWPAQEEIQPQAA